ncbi:lipid-A-disaccharide synthase N-terminal domain-containing protein [Olleya marilimosa]|uniref:Lipid-A-disaccharide synthase N-terminal domain-containing protein n=1 Tax=Olleya marilimosa TaxID=272164 RepID=A0ABR8LW18_9FLAO|nr:lipid-A-disaccharide synthase N-terminal domain-containing protein [Olleya marilimosa]MBD3863553.1 lipid-A-disaccharide synthase N-terminal domain-containing protein [Olleya marilimosa]MBD3891310.1 lipid-A-disaccharide synthase N-terminal domain-containing protein [Olleya marilimosa]
MSNWIILSIGFLAQTLFSSRLIIQWITSEKQKRVITPTLFWTLSLIASFLLFIYGYLRDDFAIMLGQGLTYYIYIRNLQLQNQWKTFPVSIRWILLLMPVFITVFYFNNNEIDTVKLFKNEAIPFWLLMLGIVSQIVFTLRFVYQWIYSEKNKASSLPLGFWALSLIGSLLILTYAIFRVDYVLLVGHSLGAIIYFRNLLILKKQDA